MPDKLHWFRFCFLGFDPSLGYRTTVHTYDGCVDRFNITHKMVQDNRASAGFGREAELVCVEYLGYMAKPEFDKLELHKVGHTAT